MDAPTAPRPRADGAAVDGPLVILAGGGRFPVLIAEAAAAAGRRVAIAALRGEAQPDIERFPHRWIGLGQLGALMRLIRREGARDLCIIGGIRNRRMPGLADIDFGGILEVIRNWRILALGDDSILRKIARGFEARGLRVVGAAEVARISSSPSARSAPSPPPPPTSPTRGSSANRAATSSTRSISVPSSEKSMR